MASGGLYLWHDLWQVLWEKRRPPVKVELAKLALPDAAATAREEQRAWSVEESAAVLLASVERIFTQRASEVGSLAFDKAPPSPSPSLSTLHSPLSLLNPPAAHARDLPRPCARMTMTRWTL